MTKSGQKDQLEGLVNLLEFIALNHITLLILVKISQPDSTFDSLFHLLHVVMNTPSRGHLTIKDGSAIPHHAGMRCPGDFPI